MTCINFSSPFISVSHHSLISSCISLITLVSSCINFCLTLYHPLVFSFLPRLVSLRCISPLAISRSWSWSHSCILCLIHGLYIVSYSFLASSCIVSSGLLFLFLVVYLLCLSPSSRSLVLDSFSFMDSHIVSHSRLIYTSRPVSTRSCTLSIVLWFRNIARYTTSACACQAWGKTSAYGHGHVCSDGHSQRCENGVSEGRVLVLLPSLLFLHFVCCLCSLLLARVRFLVAIIITWHRWQHYWCLYHLGTANNKPTHLWLSRLYAHDTTRRDA